jgi:hypothetical protein
MRTQGKRVEATHHVCLDHSARIVPWLTAYQVNSVEKQRKNVLDVFVFPFRIPEWRDVGIGKALIEKPFLFTVRRATEHRIVMG